jgi:hypothetical protein
MAKTRAHLNREVRQEALRDQLSNQKHVEHVIELAEELSKPTYTKGEEETPYEQIDIQRLKLVIDTKLKLISKYLPDLKATEMTIIGDEENPLQMEVKAVLDIDAIKKKVNDITSD